MRPQGGRLDGQEDKAAGCSHSLARAPTQPRPHAHSPTGKKCEKQDRPAWRPAQLMSAGSEIPLQPRGEMNPAPSGLSRLGRPSIPLARCLDTANKGLYSTQSGHLRMCHCFLRLRRSVSYRPASGSAGGRQGPARRSAGDSLSYEADCDAVSKPRSGHWAEVHKRGPPGGPEEPTRQGRNPESPPTWLQGVPLGLPRETPAPSKPGRVSPHPGWPDRARSPNQETVSLYGEA